MVNNSNNKSVPKYSRKNSSEDLPFNSEIIIIINLPLQNNILFS